MEADPLDDLPERFFWEMLLPLLLLLLRLLLVVRCKRRGCAGELGLGFESLCMGCTRGVGTRRRRLWAAVRDGPVEDDAAVTLTERRVVDDPHVLVRLRDPSFELCAGQQPGVWVVTFCASSTEVLLVVILECV